MPDSPKTVTRCPHCAGLISIVIETAPPLTPKAPPQQTAPNGLVPVDSLVKCRSCGDENLAWQKSKTGKSYLCRGVMKDGRAYASRREFHECPARQTW